jgi:transcriptional regulator with XRE-family HTH domain
MEKTIHHGRNIKRFREMFGMKQEALAHELGEDWNQKKISLLEAKETVEDKLLEEVAKVLKVPGEAIRGFDEEAAINIIGNTVNNHDNASVLNYYPNFNPLEKFIEQFHKTEKLYEALLKSEREKNELLERMVPK